MLCSRVQNLLSAYCDYQLTGAEMLEIREHLGNCPSCAREHASLRQVRQLLRALPTIEADRPFTPKVLEARRRLRFDLPWWYYEVVERFRLFLFRFRASACHLGTGIALGMVVMGVSALQTPPSPHAVRALVPVEIPAEPSPSATMAPGELPLAPDSGFAVVPAAAAFTYAPNRRRAGFVVPVIPASAPLWGGGYARPLSSELNGVPRR